MTWGFILTDIFLLGITRIQNPWTYERRIPCSTSFWTDTKGVWNGLNTAHVFFLRIRVRYDTLLRAKLPEQCQTYSSSRWTRSLTSERHWLIAPVQPSVFMHCLAGAKRGTCHVPSGAGEMGFIWDVVGIYAYIYTCVCMYIYICVYIYMYIYTCMYGIYIYV